jgi:hypothetical protein
MPVSVLKAETGILLILHLASILSHRRPSVQRPGRGRQPQAMQKDFQRPVITEWCGYFYGHREKFKCSGEVNSPSAKVLPKTKPWRRAAGRVGVVLS